MSALPVFARTDAAVPDTVVTFGQQRIPARVGEPLAGALLAQGVMALSRSVKYRRARGPSCLMGDCGTCLARVDGRPNIRTCMVAVRPHMRVDAQNVLGTPTCDATAPADTVFRNGFDHHHFMVRPRPANLAMQAVARTLAGLGTLPQGAHAPPNVVHISIDVLVIGAGAAGRVVTHRVATHGLSVRCVERMPMGDDLPAHVHAATGLVGIYPGEGIALAVTWDGARARTLTVVHARHVVVATGTRTPLPVFAGNDIPGVLSAQGVARMARHGLTLIQETAMTVRDDASQCAGARELPWTEIEHVQGHTHVRGVKTSSGVIAARSVVLATQTVPAFELAAQAGARVQWDGARLVPQRDASGRCHTQPGFTAWLAGEVAGCTAAQAEDDGARVARHLVEARSP